MFGNVAGIPVVFEDVYTPETVPAAVAQMKEPLAAPEEKKIKLVGGPRVRGRLFVMVHGFQGTSYDMKTIRNHLLLQYPESNFLCSSENETNTDGDIADMGTRLAAEVVKYIKRFYRDPATLGKIIFIGHSLGGVIIRAALPYLAEYKEKMHTFITFSSPHLGCASQNSKLINAGLWLLRKWHQSKCLSQLMLQDNPDVRQCFLLKLSEKEVFARAHKSRRD